MTTTRRHTWTAAVLLGVLLATGCVHVTTRVTPEPTAVEEKLEGRDCVYVVFGIGGGTATVERAKANGYPLYGTTAAIGPITKVAHVALEEIVVGPVVTKCVVVTGEGEDVLKELREEMK